MTSEPSPPAGLPIGHQHARLDSGELALDMNELARAMGYRQLATDADGADQRRVIPEHMTTLAAEMLSRGRELLEPQWLWVPVPVTIDSSREVLTCRPPLNATLAIGKTVRVQLRGCLAIAAFVVTIGDRLETEARRLMQAGQPLEGYVLDAVGSLAAEATADVLEKRVAAAVTVMDWKITNRFSPGYCSWETADQRALFKLFPERPVGVTLSKSALMTPIKSISGLIGLGADVEYRPYPCEFCTLTTCHQRLTEARLGTDTLSSRG
ncbi:MAG: vitamin B12 dependent-methionine synthase activation domain-containing protein [Planctomycetota bacterium]